MSLGIFEVLVLISFKGPVAHDDWGLCIPQLCGCHSIIYIYVVRPFVFLIETHYCAGDTRRRRLGLLGDW